jgi:hypothetical protein
MKINAAILLLSIMPFLLGTQAYSNKHGGRSKVTSVLQGPKRLGMVFYEGRTYVEGPTYESEDYGWKGFYQIKGQPELEINDIEFSLKPRVTLSKDEMYIFAHTWENEKHVCHVFDMLAQPRIVLFKTKSGKEVNCENTKGEWSETQDHVLKVIIDDKKTEDAFLQN